MKTSPRHLGIGLSAAGFCVSAFLEVVHAQAYLAPGAKSLCTVGETLDCGTVAISPLSVVAGVPLPIWGAAGFLALGLAAHKRSRLFVPLAALAALVSIGLFIASMTHIGALCMLCEAVHVLALALLGVAWVGRKDVDTDTSWGRGAVDILFSPAALVVLAALFAPKYWQPLTWQSGVPLPHGVDDEGRHWVGAETPKITVEEFVDYGCPHCAVASNRMRMRLARDADELRVIRRHQPRTPCNTGAEGCGGVRAVLCAGDQDKYWEMDSWLFLHVPGKPEVDLSEGAAAIGLDVAAFETCVTAEATYARANEERRAAFKRRIRNTPTYVLEGKRLDAAEIHEQLDLAL